MIKPEWRLRKGLNKIEASMDESIRFGLSFKFYQSLNTKLYTISTLQVSESLFKSIAKSNHREYVQSHKR